jgi:hypothetical protein
MVFGRCFSTALEALHRGQDGEVAWVKSYATAQAAGELPPGSPSIEHGLALLGLYTARGIGQGEPEWRFELRLPDRERIPVPIVGYCDLVTDTEIMEAKTTSRNWSQGDVDGAMQAAIYYYAYLQAFGRKPRCVRYLIFSTRRVEMKELLAYPSGDAVRLFELRAAATWRGIRDGVFPAICKKPWCGACVDAGVVPSKLPRSNSLELTF